MEMTQPGHFLNNMAGNKAEREDMSLKLKQSDEFF